MNDCVSVRCHHRRLRSAPQPALPNRGSCLREDYLAGNLPFHIETHRVTGHEFQLQIEWNVDMSESDLAKFVYRIFDGLFDSDVFYHTMATAALSALLRIDSTYAVISVLSHVYRRIRALLLTRVPNSILCGLTIIDKVIKALEQTTNHYVISCCSKRELVDHYIVFKSTLGEITGEHYVALMQTINRILRCMRIYVDLYNAQKDYPKPVKVFLRPDALNLDERVTFSVKCFAPSEVDNNDFWRQERRRKRIHRSWKRDLWKCQRLGRPRRGRFPIISDSGSRHQEHSDPPPTPVALPPIAKLKPEPVQRTFTPWKRSKPKRR